MTRSNSFGGIFVNIHKRYPQCHGQIMCFEVSDPESASTVVTDEVSGWVRDRERERE